MLSAGSLVWAWHTQPEGSLTAVMMGHLTSPDLGVDMCRYYCRYYRYIYLYLGRARRWWCVNLWTQMDCLVPQWPGQGCPAPLQESTETV